MNEKDNSHSRSGRWGIIIKVILVTVIIGALIIAARAFNFQQVFRDALLWISGLGPLGPMIFIGIYILACVLQERMFNIKHGRSAR